MLKLSAVPVRSRRVRFAVLCNVALLAVPSQALSNELNAGESHDSVCSELTEPLSIPQLEACGATIGEILIDNQDIFDLNDPEENSQLYRLANKVHVNTRPAVIRQQLLFRTGETFSGRVLAESERILRGNTYIQEATISPVHVEGGVVNLQVETVDVWTLNVAASFARKGGENSAGFGFKEANLLGTGILIGAGYKAGVDRDSIRVTFRDQQLGTSWIGLSAIYALHSDGYTRMLRVDRPFFSFESKRAGGIFLLDDDRVESLYDQGDAVSDYRRRTRSYKAYGGWSNGLSGSWTRR